MLYPDVTPPTTVFVDHGGNVAQRVLPFTGSGTGLYWLALVAILIVVVGCVALALTTRFRNN